ncbi:MAG: hypothetical protein AB1451_16875 [Nitrospirota bacterium]
MAENDLIAVAELADELGTHRASVFKVVKRLGIQPVKRRDAERGGQRISLVTGTEASAIREAFATGRSSGDEASGDGVVLAADEGWFYLIQLEPEHDPGRFKVGFTTDRDGRLRHHRCSAPFAQYRKQWPCRRTWERAAIDCMTNGLEQLHTEVFRGPSLDDVLSRGDRFFAVMPAVGEVTEETDEESEAAG